MQRHGRNERVDAVVRREASIVGLKNLEVPTLEDVEHRRLHLWIVMVVIVVAITAAMAGGAIWGESHDGTLTFGVLGLVIGFSAYSIEKELHLRRLTGVIVDERVLVTALAGRLEELSVLLDAGQAMNAVLELDEVLHRILDNALGLLGASDGSVLLDRRGRRAPSCRVRERQRRRPVTPSCPSASVSPACRGDERVAPHPGRARGRSASCSPDARCRCRSCTVTSCSAC